MKITIFDPSLLRSPQPMVEMLYRLQTQAEDSVNLGQFWRRQEPTASGQGEQCEIHMDGLLQPPGIERVDIDDDEGEGEPIIFVSTAGDAGAIKLAMSIRDEAGNPVECSGAIYIPGSGTEWGCSILEPLPPGMLLHVSVTASDCVGGVRVEHRRLVVP